MPEKPKNRYKGVFQVLDDEVIAHYKTTTEASKQTGINKATISLVCNDKRKAAGGYDWIYA